MSAATAGRVVLVTGAASGIGQHLARRLLASGSRVAAADLNIDGLSALAPADATENLLRLKLDVRDAASWQSAFEQVEQRWGAVDVLLNVAGVLKPGYVTEIEAKDIDFHLDINAKGTMLGTAMAARRIVARRAGHIVNIASLAGIAPVPGLLLYSASKFAVRGFTLAAAQELHAQGVRVTCVCPDAVQTPMLDLQKNAEQAALTFSGKRSLTVEEIGDAVIDVALVKAPLEITLPPARGRDAKIASAFPVLALKALEAMRRKGLRRQAKTRVPA
jgi:3-oxoacyl-[acyl-carrier protein] reductase